MYVLEALLKLCWSGAVALIMLAPPCKEYSRLKLRPGGPKALRTPQHTHGVPGLSPCQLKNLEDSIIFFRVCLFGPKFLLGQAWLSFCINASLHRKTMQVTLCGA